MRIYFTLLAGALLATCPGAIRAGDCGSPGCGGAVAGGVAGAAGCGYTTVWEKVYVQEPYSYTKTSYRQEQRTENYTAYRTETVPETKTRTVTTMRHVTETVMENRCITKRIPVCETRTEMVSKRVRVCYEETVAHTVNHWSWVKSCVCDPCDPCGRGKTTRQRVNCPTTECKTVTKHRWDTVCEPVTRTCTTWKCVTENCQVPVCRTRCVPECRTETYTCCTTRCVPYQATRCFTVCVPVCETVNATRCVCKMVCKQVPCAPACDTGCHNQGCGDACGSSGCGDSCGKAPRARRSGRSKGCASDCASSCASAVSCCH